MESLGSLMRCSNCSDYIEKEITIFNKLIRVKVICSCKKKEMEEKAQREELEEKNRRLNSLVKNSLMEKGFYEGTFENWDFNKGKKKYYELGKKYVENFSKIKEKGLGLIIYGGVGNGKSYLSFSIANELLKTYRTVVCISVNGLLDRIKETYNNWGNEGEREVINSLRCADLLIIDDLGVEKSTEWSNTKIYDIIDSRYRNKLPVIITTNHSIGELREKYGERTADRLCEICINIEYKGNSLRREAGRENVEILRGLIYE